MSRYICRRGATLLARRTLEQFRRFPLLSDRHTRCSWGPPAAANVGRKGLPNVPSSSASSKPPSEVGPLSSGRSLPDPASPGLFAVEDGAQSLGRQFGSPPSPVAVHQHPVQIIRRDEVLRRCGFKKTTLYAAMAEGRFPRAIHLGPRAVGWLAHEIDQRIALRVAESCLPDRPVTSTAHPGPSASRALPRWPADQPTRVFLPNMPAR